MSKIDAGMRLARNEGLTLGSILPRIDRLELICLASISKPLMLPST
jgi:hypothetical protein